MSKPTARELVDYIGPTEWGSMPAALAARVEKVLALVEPLAGMAEGTARGLLADRIRRLLNGEEP